MRLESGRKCFYQWEENQRLEVPEGCTEVHFANGTSDRAWGVDTFVDKGKRLVEVPDTMLQVAAPLRCYAWDGASVIEHMVFDVIPKEKPDVYVEPEEIPRFDKLLKELEEKGAYYYPVVDAEGNLTWGKSLEQMPDAPGGNIRGPQGPQGPQGVPGTVNIDDTSVGADAWSSKSVVDKLCPAFSAEGYVASCEPLDGYPLEVISTFDSRSALNNIKLTRCGKNLFDFKQGAYPVGWVSGDGSNRSYFGYEIHLPAGTYTLHAEKGIQQSSDYIYGIVRKINGENASYLLVQGANTNKTQTLALEQGDVIYIYDGYKRTEAEANDLFARNKVQIEAGSVATAYEDYKGSEWSVDFANVEDGVYVGSYNWQTGVLNCESGMFQCDPQTNTFTYIDNLSTYVPSVVRNIPAQSGVNYLYSDCGDTEVKGKADPVIIIEKQEARLAALEAAIINNT